MNLSRAARPTRVSNAVAGGFGDTVTSSSVDMQGFGAVQFIILLGAIASSGSATARAQQSADDGSSDAFADLEGTGVDAADTDDNSVIITDIMEPRERHVRTAIDRATANVAIDGIIALQYLPGQQPVTHDSTVLASEFHHAPAEGTA